MSMTTTYACDHCGAPCSGNIYASLWGDGDETKAYGHTRLDGCSKEHLGIVVAKTFGMNANAPANQCTDAERQQFEITIEQQKTRIAELETQLATLNDWAAICGGKTPTVDGQTPGQVAYAEYACLMGITPDLAECGVITATCWERAAQAVLRVFGPVLAKQAVVDALGKVRERIQETITKSSKWMALSIIEAEIARLDMAKPTSDHVHELGSYAHYDKQGDVEPPNITIPTKPTKPLVLTSNCTICGCPNERAFLELCRGDAKHNFEVTQ